MKTIRRLVAVAAVGALAVGLAPPAFAAPNDLVNIPDEGLRNCLAYTLNVDSAPSYTEAQLSGLTSLHCYSEVGGDVSDLTGLEHATQLSSFDAYGSALTDVGPLRALPLTELELHSEAALDLAPLAGNGTLATLRYSTYAANPPALPNLPGLIDLELSDVPLSVISSSALPKLTSLSYSGDYSTPSDLSMLPSLPELTSLSIRGTELAAIPSSVNLPKLTSFSARGVSLRDVSGLSSLPALTTLDLRWNLVTAIPNNVSLPKLQQADLSGNQFTTISGLPKMPALERLDVDSNRLAALPALDLPKLDWLGLANNQISTIASTTKLPELNGISLVGNRLTNISALRSYPSLSTVFVKGNQLTDLSNLTTVYPFKGQLHARSQRLPAGPTVKACTSVPLRTVKGAPDSKHPINWDLPPGTIRNGSNIVYPESTDVESYGIEFSQLGRFTRSDSKDDIYFSGYYTQKVQKATGIFAPTPTITGSVRYGSRVSVHTGSWCPAASRLAYQWLRNGAPIAKATGAAYAPTITDIGKKISVRVTGSRAGMTTVSKTSAQTVVAKGVLGAKTPAITGTAKKGKTLKVKMATWTPAPVKISYQWLRNGAAISKATKSSYTLTSKDTKKYISVRVTGVKSGYATTSRTSARTAKVA